MIAKKFAKGYTLLEEPCDDCEMPMMQDKKGKVGCKVCPVIKKWVFKKQDQAMEVEDVEREEKVVHYTRDVHVDTMENDDTRDEECVERDVEEEEHRCEVVCDTSDEAVANEDIIETPLNAISTVSSLGQRCIGESASYESDNDTDENKYIQDRARQIIAETRNRGGWNNESSLSQDEVEEKPQKRVVGVVVKKSSESEGGNEEYKAHIEERAEEIIRRARVSLQRSQSGVAVAPPTLLSPRTKTRNKHVSTMWD